MKLYTEEQVNLAMRLMVEDRSTFKQILEQLTPIELPNRDIADEASLSNSVESNIDFINGFIWTIRQILNQNK